jgi:SAM-dependent methyltransferase
MALRFETDFRYTDRETKAQYVWLKYRPLLKGRILDVGADECYLRQYLDEDADYWGVGLGGYPDQQVDLENEKIPFPDNSFDCVLCLDVLEHLDNIYEVFDELCRVSRHYGITSLPNPWRDFWSCLRSGDYYPGQPMKFYGLPLEPPEDRHKWFFSNEEAEKFIIYRAAKNGMRIVQTDNYGMGTEGSGWKRLVKTLAKMILFRNTARLHNLYAGTL